MRPRRDTCPASVSHVEYKSGVKTSIDAATRRHIISQVGQASGRITMGYMEEFGHDLVFTSAHFGARPEHEVWQGKAYSLSGPKTVGGVPYPDFCRATEYGEVAGLLGVNCRHSYGPYYPGITELPTVPDKMDGMTSEERYKQVQKQRGIEREIRDKKRDIYNAELAGADVTQFRLELGKQQSRLRAHTEKYSLVREPRREKAYGITRQPRALKSDRLHRRTTITERMGGMGDTPNAVNWTKVKSPEYRMKFDSLTDDAEVNALVYQETLRILNHRNNSNLEDFSIVNRTKGSLLGRSTNAKVEGRVRYTERIKKDITKTRGRGERLIAVHNHPNSAVPSASDIASLSHRGYDKSVVACHDGRVFVVDSIDDTFSPVFYNEHYKKMIALGHDDTESAILSLRRLERDYHLRWRELL